MSDWIEWNGGECPVEKGVKVDVICRDGAQYNSKRALVDSPAKLSHWVSDGVRMDITTYRLSDVDTPNPLIKHDEVTNPKHYDLFPGQQSINIIKSALTEEEWQGFLKGNVLKYRLRAGEKGEPKQCIAKANWYRDKLWEGVK